MLGTRHPEWKNRNDSCFSTQTLVIADNKQLSCQKKLCCINSFELRKLSNIPGFRYAIQLGEWILSLCVLRECLSVRLRANYVTFLTCLFVRWGKEREKCWNKSMCACVYVHGFHSVRLRVRGRWYSADQVPTVAPAPHKDRKRYRGQIQAERKQERKADGGEDRWDEREMKEKTEKTWWEVEMWWRMRVRCSLYSCKQNAEPCFRLRCDIQLKEQMFFFFTSFPFLRLFLCIVWQGIRSFKKGRNGEMAQGDGASQIWTCIFHLSSTTQHSFFYDFRSQMWQWFIENRQYSGQVWVSVCLPWMFL